MVKKIDLEFPDNFIPPEKFTSPLCTGCPFFLGECNDFTIGCTLLEKRNVGIRKLYNATNNDTILKYISTDCPIRNYFN